MSTNEQDRMDAIDCNAHVQVGLAAETIGDYFAEAEATPAKLDTVQSLMGKLTPDEFAVIEGMIVGGINKTVRHIRGIL